MYEAIALAIASDVANGRLKTGERLPTHRDLAGRLGVTVGTVSRAYAEAARRGLVSGEVGRGTFVRGDASPDDTGLVDLASNHPPLPPGDALTAALEDAFASLAGAQGTGELLAYPPDSGYARHREAGAQWLAWCGLDTPPDRVLACSGSQHALAIVLSTLLRPGETLATEALTYPGLQAVANLLHLRLQGLPMDRHGLEPGAFESACLAGGLKAVYLVPTIHNPTTRMMPLERRQQIARIARAHGVAIVEDDIHAHLPSERPAPVASLAPELAYFITSTSKTLAPGLRVGYLLAPADHLERLTAAARATVWASAPLMAEIATLWIRQGTAQRLLAARRGEAVARQKRAREALAGWHFEAHPEGYHVWLQLPEPWTSVTFSAQARRHGVAVTPSEAFVIGREPAPHAVRLCLGAARSRASLDRGLGLVASLLRESPEPTLAVG